MIAAPTFVLALLLTFAAPDDLTAIDKKLRSADERERRTGVQEAAQVGSREGWMRVIEALADVSPQVADEAEIQLGRLHDADVFPELCGKRGLLSKDPWVAAHAAGAIGSITGTTFPSALLVPGLESKSLDVRRILCTAIGNLGAGNQLSDPAVARGALARIGRREDPELRAAAWLAEWRFDAKSNPDLDEKHAADVAPVVCARLMAIVNPRDETARKFIDACAKSPERSVRAQVTATIAANPDAESLRRLVTLLEVEKNPRLRDTIDAQLERLSGFSGGGKAEFWRDWVDHLPAEWKPVTRDAKPRERKGDTAVAQLVGMPIVSDRIAILVDFSGSTWQKRDGEKTRKDQLDIELKKALEALPADTLFNVVPYTNEPVPWEKGLVPATPANVQRALKFFTGCKASGKGNFWDAAMLALEWTEVDTILVLTDGAPTGGHRWNVDLMRERYVERNRFRHVALDAVIVDASKGMQARWRTFCEATGGRMLAIDMK